jgi:chemotaxis protein CheD
VGAAVWSPRLRIGALCHAQLPRAPAEAGEKLGLAAGRRYVDFAMRDLLRQFDELDANRSELQVKLFGGADVLVVSAAAAAPTIGRMNCEVALAVAEAEGLHIVASSLGGTSGLNIKFHTGTGEVLLWRLHRVVEEKLPAE